MQFADEKTTTVTPNSTGTCGRSRIAYDIIRRPNNYIHRTASHRAARAFIFVEIKGEMATNSFGEGLY